MISRLRPRLILSAILFLIAVDLQGAYLSSLQVPSFIAVTPAGHFAGVSAPCPTLSEARKSAVLDVVRQVLGAIGASYGYGSRHYVRGNVRGEGPQRTIEENLSGNIKGIVMGVEQNIVKSTWSMDGSGRFVYFVLIRYPDEKIRKMRRLSKGAKLTASNISNPSTDGIKLKVSEVNGVSVVLTSADIVIRQHNRFSKAISLFLWKVPSMIEHKSSISIEPVEICGNSANIRLPINNIRKSLTDYLVGANLELSAILNGYDEIARPVAIKIENIFPK
jgi:hypothetical protein